MDDIIRTDDRDPQIAALQHEIYELTKKIQEQEEQSIQAMTSDPADPFANPTDYKGFGGDYTKILPRLGEPGFSVPLEPEAPERKSLRKAYSVGAWGVIFSFIASNGLAILLIGVVRLVMNFLNSNAESGEISDYLRSSSVLPSMNMLIFLICNVGFGLVCMKWADIKPRSLIRTKDFGFGKAVMYCLIGLFLWFVSVYTAAGICDILDKYGIDAVNSSGDVGTTILGRIVNIIYTCIIAPVTEEFFYRGMVLRTFSKANQRFAIIASALFFGVAHGNIPQFILGFIVGIFLAHITLKHNSIIPSIIVHIFVNSFSSIFGEIDRTSNIAMFIMMMVMLLGSLLGMTMLLVFLSKDSLPTPTPHQAKRGLPIAAGSLTMIAATILEFGNLIYNLIKN